MAGALAASAHADVVPSPAVSSNWAGYAAAATDLSLPATADTSSTTPLAFTDVTATWVEPKTRCTPGTARSAAFWIGLGGANDSSQGLEQIGTVVDCTRSGTVRHSAWYEILPAASVPLKLKIAAGDTVTAAILARGTTVTLQLTNRTKHTRYTKQVSVAQLDLSSAEWVAEAPSVCTGSGRCEILPLANFGKMTFTKAAATVEAGPGVISSPLWTATPIALIPGRTRPRFPGAPPGALDTVSPGAALPGPLSADGRSFSVTWHATA